MTPGEMTKLELAAWKEGVLKARTRQNDASEKLVKQDQTGEKTKLELASWKNVKYRATKPKEDHSLSRLS